MIISARRTLANDCHNSNILIYKKHNMFTCPYVQNPPTICMSSNEQIHLQFVCPQMNGFPVDDHSVFPTLGLRGVAGGGTWQSAAP